MKARHFDLKQPWDELSRLLEKPVFLEASAGSGKTYTLERLVLLYLLDGTPLDLILGVTFTEKSAQDLRTKVRSLLRTVLAEIQKWRSGLLSLGAWKSALGLGEDAQIDPETAYIRVKQALGSFSRGHFTTIHGFCQSVLKSFPFESGTGFSTEVKSREWERKSALDLLRRTVDSFSRSQWESLGGSIDDAVDLLLSMREKQWFRPESSPARMVPSTLEVEKMAREILSLEEDMETPGTPLETILEGFRRLKIPPDQEMLDSKVLWFCRPAWRPSSLKSLKTMNSFRGSFLELLKFLEDNSKALYRWCDPLEDYNHTGKKRPLLGAEDVPGGDLGDCRTQAAALITGLQEVLTPLISRLQEFQPPGEKPLETGFYASMVCRLELLHRLLPRLDSDLEKRSKDEGVITFGSMISQVYQAVQNPESTLLPALRDKYKVILIDEFQDTDRQQWGIFKTAFLIPGHRLVTVGDEKQGIYGFRGADLQVFQMVRNIIQSQEVQGSVLTLPRNFRSGKLLVDGVNTLSSRLFPPGGSIHFEDALAQADQGCRVLDSLPPVEIVRLPQEYKNTAQIFRAAILDTVARIQKLLGTPWQPKEDPKTTRNLDLGDFAVLVSTGKEGLQVQREFALWGIQATMSGRGELWQSQEVKHLELFFRVLSNPAKGEEVLALGLSPLMGLHLDEMVGPKGKQGVLQWQAQLSQEGARARMGQYLTVFQSCFCQPGPQQWFNSYTPLQDRIFNTPTGERSWTNYFHVLEMLQELNLHLDEIPGFLGTKRTGFTGEDETNLRLDRDEKAVKIMTLHTSKGLEFPVVFVLGGAKHPSNRGPGESLDDKGQKQVRFMVKNGTLETAYLDSERRRLMYVGFTRAQAKLIIPCPGSEFKKAAGWMKEWQAMDWNTMGMGFYPREAMVPSAQSKSTAVVSQAPERPKGLPASELGPRTIHQTSYTSLTKKAGPNLIPHLDSTPLILEKPAVSWDWLKSAAGKEFGSFYHKILEEMDFRTLPDKETIIKAAADYLPRTLADEAHRWAGGFAAHLESLMTHRWSLPQGPTFRFADLDPSQVWKEKSFHILTGGNHKPFLGSSIRVPRGFIKGEIDLVFRLDDKLYLLDWKTTTMPGESFTSEDFMESMSHHGYMVQLGLYWTALNRLCGLWGQGLSPGGVLYSYLRHDRMVLFRPSPRETQDWDLYFKGGAL